MADWTPPPPGAWAQSAFTPIPGIGPNPKLGPEVQQLDLNNATVAGKLPYVPAQSAADAQKAQNEATIGRLTLPDVVSTKHSEAITAAKNANKADADAGVSAQQLKDYFIGKRQMELTARTALQSILNNEVQAQQPNVGGVNEARAQSWINNGSVPRYFTGGYDASNQGMFAHGLESSKAAMAALNTQVANLAKAPGTGTGSASGMMIRNLQEFLAQAAASGQYNPAANLSTSMGTQMNNERIVRTLLARQAGIDPNKVDVMSLPLGRLGINNLHFTAPIDTGSDLYRRLAPPGVTQPINHVPAAAAPSVQVGMPKIGEVRKGYAYKGGDPSQQSSWVKAQ